MAVTTVSQSSIKEGLEKFPKFTGGFSPIFTDFESIATVMVGSGGASGVTFSSIPQTYQHLQLRVLLRDTNGVSLTSSYLRWNSDTTWSLYASHGLRGNGSAATAVALTGSDSWLHDAVAAGSAPSSVFSAAVIDILDYSSTSKNTVLRSFGGADLNGSGMVEVSSSLYASTSAISTFQILGSSYAQHSTFALYGVKAP
jgi:hypothetical protein